MSSEEPDLPVAAEVSGNEAGKYIIWKEYGFENSKVGTLFVKKSDAMEAIKEARRQERQKILDKIEYRKSRVCPYTPLKIRKATLGDLRDELEEEVERS